MDVVTVMLAESSLGHITLGEHEQNRCAGASGACGPAMQLGLLGDILLPAPTNSSSGAVAGHVSRAASAWSVLRSVEPAITFSGPVNSPLIAPAASAREVAENFSIPLTTVKNARVLEPMVLTELQLTTIISVQSLLVQFSHSRVRADFVGGKFEDNINPNLLSRMDDLRWLLFPSWSSGGFESAVLRSQKAAYHLILLLNQSTTLLVADEDSLEECLTYCEWFKTLQTIAADRYWMRLPCEERCTHILQSDSAESQQKYRVLTSNLSSSRTNLSKGGAIPKKRLSVGVSSLIKRLSINGKYL